MYIFFSLSLSLHLLILFVNLVCDISLFISITAQFSEFVLALSVPLPSVKYSILYHLLYVLLSNQSLSKALSESFSEFDTVSGIQLIPFCK